MEQLTVSESLKHLEKLLRDYERDPGLLIVSATEKAGTKPGDNYMSHVARTKLVGKRGDGTPYENNVITKRLPDGRMDMGLMRTRDFFTNEAHVYMRILPRLGLEFIAPKCFEANANSLIMEDLYLAGYEMNERRNLMDLRHCEATLKAQSRLHAHSLMFKLRNPAEFEALMEPLKEPAFPQDDEPALGQTIGSGLHAAITNLESIKNPDRDTERAIVFLKDCKDEAYETMRRLVARSNEKYDAMTHGDTWNNNIFFRRDPRDGRVESVKFVDYQCCRHTTVAIDFHYFVYTSARNDVIAEHYRDLVKLYRESLVEEMRKLGASDAITRDLSTEWFEAELRKTSMYGLLTGLWLVNALLATPEDVHDLNAITPEYLEGRVVYEVPVRDDQVERTKSIVFHYCRTYGNIA